VSRYSQHFVLRHFQSVIMAKFQTRTNHQVKCCLCVWIFKCLDKRREKFQNWTGEKSFRIWLASNSCMNVILTCYWYCGPPAWGLGVGLETPHRKKQIRYEKDQWASDLDGFFG
jgi:hypothetical protein